jgi:hypothetical protein
MVTLEAWALGKPVLANGRCDVLAGQCIRSHAGLYYENADEFGAALDRLLDDTALSAAMGRSGQRYYASHYSWPVIEGRYLEMFERLTTRPPGHVMEPLPNLLRRRARSRPPAAGVIASLPSGPAVASRVAEGAIS